MQVGVVNMETWAFFKEIFTELEQRHTVNRFEPVRKRFPIFSERINRNRYQQYLRSFFHDNQVVFFEWASEVLCAASHGPKQGGVVTRLHRYELYQYADKINWEWVDRIILVSNAKKREFDERFPDFADRSVMIPEGVQLERFISRPHDFSGQIGTLSYLTPRKRVYELILAFNEVLKVQPGFTLHIGGAEHELFMDYFRALHTLVKQLGIEERVIFYGRITDQEAWYNKIDVFVSNSYSEGLQVSPMEAIASGRYCISHTWEGAEQLLPADALFTTQDELVDCILAYADMSETCRQDRLAQQQAVVRANFDMEKIKMLICDQVDQVGALYKR